jgi:hypothetical protein
MSNTNPFENIDFTSSPFSQQATQNVVTPPVENEAGNPFAQNVMILPTPTVEQAQSQIVQPGISQIIEQTQVQTIPVTIPTTIPTPTAEQVQTIPVTVPTTIPTPTVEQVQTIPVTIPTTIPTPTAEQVQTTLPGTENMILPGQALPELEPGQTIICRLTPGKYDTFIKILSLLDDKNIINISNSIICQSVQNDNAILKVDISKLVDSKNVNLDILQPKKYIKVLKAIKSNNDIFIIDDPRNERYIVRSGKLKLWLAKQIEQLNNETKLPNLDNAIGIGGLVTIGKEEKNSITSLISEKNELTLLIQNGQLKGYSIPELLEAPFRQYEQEEVSESKAELKLTSYAFLCVSIDGDSSIALGQADNKYWMKTIINNAIVDIEVLESLSPSENKIML